MLCAAEEMEKDEAEKQPTAISMKDFAKAIRNLKPNDGIGYAAELTLKVEVKVWVETDEAGNISHFTPHVNAIIKRFSLILSVPACLK